MRTTKKWRWRSTDAFAPTEGAFVVRIDYSA
jgi:hypothetical protein